MGAPDLVDPDERRDGIVGEAELKARLAELSRANRGTAIKQASGTDACVKPMHGLDARQPLVDIHATEQRLVKSRLKLFATSRIWYSYGSQVVLNMPSADVDLGGTAFFGFIDAGASILSVTGSEKLRSRCA